jgi:hypothetical protein
LELRDCFREDFIDWLSNSNNDKIKPYVTRFMNSTSFSLGPKLDKVVEESLQEILDILLREPLADYFWYTYPANGSELTYSAPLKNSTVGYISKDSRLNTPQVVPGDALRVDKEKIKIFLRDYKLQTLLSEQEL